MQMLWQPRLDAQVEQYRARAEALTRDHFAPLAAELDREQQYPWGSVALLAQQGLAGMFVPQVYGGGGAPLAASVAVVETVARGCASTAAILAAYQLGAFPILLEGTDAQKRKYLQAQCRGDAVSFALSERHAGSDASAIHTTAVPEGGGFRLRGEKFWIGNGGASRYYVVFAKTTPEAGARGISAFIVERDTQGVVIDSFADKMGIRGTQTSNLRLDAWVEADALVGERDRALRLALSTLNVGRVIVAAQSTGIGLAAFEAAAQRAVTRETFGKPIIDHQGIGFRLADMATEISAARMMLYETAAAYDRGEDIATLGAMTKLYTSEVSHRAVDAAVQVFGGYGYCKPSVVERLYRDQRIVEIYEGSSEIQRVVLARAVKSEYGRRT